MGFQKGNSFGHGRKGVPNRQTQEQRAFAERVCYGQDGKGRIQFEIFVRNQLLANNLPMGVFQLILFYLLGKPVERVAMNVDSTADYSQCSVEELAERAQALSAAAKTLTNAAKKKTS
jgi:hypothetical protein